MGKHLVLAGAGHAHMLAMASLKKFTEKKHRVTVIGPGQYHYYSGMGPGMLGKIYNPEQIRFDVKHIVEQNGGAFVKDKVTSIDPEGKNVILESGESISYDVISCNTGSYVPTIKGADSFNDLYTVKPIENLLLAQNRILELVSQNNIRIGIIGGGPSTVEVSGNIWHLVKKHGGKMPLIQIFTGRGLITDFPAKVRKKAVQIMRHRGMEILTDNRVAEIKPGEIITESDKHYENDLIIMATGVKPSPVFRKSGLPTGSDGGLLVNKYLQSPKYPEIFGGGDCIFFEDQPLDKVGVYAVRQNPVLLNNLMASLEGSKLEPFDPGGEYLLIFNMGGRTGILHKSWLTFGGRLAFIIKDYIDRRFMKKFQ